jgi:NHL repeat.
MKFLILSLISILSFAQIKTQFLTEFGEFSNASSFTIASNGILYVSDVNKNEISSFDTLGNKLKDVGGFGRQSGLFDQPVDIFANPLAVYVADKNNHRIQQFDRNLNFISSLSTRNDDFEKSFGYPLSVAVSNQDDLFILDGENTRVIKFDMFGNFLPSFGGIDGGNFKLKKPSSLSVDSRGLVFVSDYKTLNIFDSFGNGLNKVNFNHQIKSIRIIFNDYVIVTKNSIHKLIIENESLKIEFLEVPDVKVSDIKSALIFNHKLYLLLFNKIKVFSIVQ